MKLLEQVEDNSIIIVASAYETLRNADTTYPFRQNSDFHYLTGFSEPDALLILKKGEANPYTLFVRPKDRLPSVRVPCGQPLERGVDGWSAYWARHPGDQLL